MSIISDGKRILMFEYLTIIRTTRGISANEAEELNDFLTDYAKAGWWLHTVLPGSTTNGGVHTQTYIFERSNHESDS